MFCRRLHYRPTDSELEEFHPKATRTLFVGGLSRDATQSAVSDKFDRFGEILDVDIKKTVPMSVSGERYANVQFTDIASVCRAILSLDGSDVAGLGLGGQRLKLGFARAVPTKCVWCSGVAETVKEKDIAHEFGRYGKIQDILILRSKAQALVWFDQVRKILWKLRRQ